MVYVDDYNAKFKTMIMCHMVADSLPELHAMAEAIGVKRKWFQDTSVPHYDVSLSKRKKAVSAGAIEISSKEIFTIVRKNCVKDQSFLLFYPASKWYVSQSGWTSSEKYARVFSFAEAEKKQAEMLKNNVKVEPQSDVSSRFEPLVSCDFQTPIPICEYMVNLLEFYPKNILEPTPGIGNIVKVIKNKFPQSKITTPSNFYDIERNYFDAIIMNPPFSPMKLGYDILYKCLDISDRIIALMPYLTIINSEKRTKDLFNFGIISITHLPRKIFNGSRVQTCILNMKKGFQGKTHFGLLNS